MWMSHDEVEDQVGLLDDILRQNLKLHFPKKKILLENGREEIVQQLTLE